MGVWVSNWQFSLKLLIKNYRGQNIRDRPRFRRTTAI